jgi:hypothetical protein
MINNIRPVYNIHSLCLEGFNNRDGKTDVDKWRKTVEATCLGANERTDRHIWDRAQATKSIAIPYSGPTLWIFTIMHPPHPLSTPPQTLRVIYDLLSHSYRTLGAVNIPSSPQNAMGGESGGNKRSGAILIQVSSTILKLLRHNGT